MLTEIIDTERLVSPGPCIACIDAEEIRTENPVSPRWFDPACDTLPLPPLPAAPMLAKDEEEEPGEEEEDDLDGEDGDDDEDAADGDDDEEDFDDEDDEFLDDDDGEDDLGGEFDDDEETEEL